MQDIGSYISYQDMYYIINDIIFSFFNYNFILFVLFILFYFLDFYILRYNFKI